jgi:hypothetical protein
VTARGPGAVSAATVETMSSAAMEVGTNTHRALSNIRALALARRPAPALGAFPTPANPIGKFSHCPGRRLLPLMAEE